ncbi:soluble calcium-activated nucleotidase 1-like [Adelges cooleyi]|uniref:soluble calcium-activated nucleotidase 1-like n=1 Tax=Adelges cooleyi TaxID=133065 RepID=UPI00218039AF|nr:soluble calcium-activated nucleotidase 1-like [Adelges cooleyi]
MFYQALSLLLLAVIASHTVLSAPADNPNAACNLVEEPIDERYPLTNPVNEADGTIKYRMAIISDLDADSKSSKEELTWISYLKKGYLKYNPKSQNVSITWDNGDGEKYKSNMAIKDRGMELSELVTYNGKLLTIDDKTGIIYEVLNENSLIPWVVVTEGDGRNTKTFKNEWATVKGKNLYVGTHGKELVSKDGLKVTSQANMWIKVITVDGGVKHVNWTQNFIKLRAAFGIHFPGYMTHESCVWSNVHGRFFFLPRKASTDKYDFSADERKATNVLLSASPNFSDIKVVRVGEIVPTHGYASFKFIPNTNDSVIVAIKTEEVGETTGTFITVFTIDGKILYPETKVSGLKFEGFEFI